MTNRIKFAKRLTVVYSFNEKAYYLSLSRFIDGEQVSFLKKISEDDAKYYIDIYDLKEKRRDEHGIWFD